MKALSDFSSLNAYIKWANSIPLLEPEEEFKLLQAINEDRNNCELVTKLISPFVRLAISIARKNQGYGIPMEDLIQEGCIGLLKAVEKFDISRNVKFASYATIWVNSMISQYAIDNSKIIRYALTKDDRKLFFNFRKMAASLQAEAGRHAASLNTDQVQIISECLNISEDKIRAMEWQMSGLSKGSPTSVWADREGESSYGDDEFDFMSDNSYSPESIIEASHCENLHSKYVYDALSVLTDRERDIIQSRWLDNDTKVLADLSKQYGVSGERIRQIESKALKKMKAELEPIRYA
jgi:RNA polymerase sigma-32 factor